MAILDAAVSDLGGMLSQLRSSMRYRTKARYVLDQSDFINLAVSGFTSLAPDALLQAIHAIEAKHGRNRLLERLKGPRSLDIDIILYGNMVVDTPQLCIPHPALAERAFVLAPLLDLDAQLVHPVSGQALSQLLEALPDQGIYPIDSARL